MKNGLSKERYDRDKYIFLSTFLTLQQAKRFNITTIQQK